MRRVVITGLGTVNALGSSVAESWPRMLRGESGVRPIDHFDAADLPVRFSGHVIVDLVQHFTAPDFRKLDPFVMYALLAAKEALGDAGLPDIREEPEESRERYACIIGTGIGGITGIVEQQEVLHDRGARRVTPHFIPRIMPNAVSGQVAIAQGLMGTVFTTSSACASSGHAIGMAMMAIRSGEADLCITGGSESATTPLAVAGFASAKARGAKIYAEVKGYGSTDDAFHITAPREDGSGPSRAFVLAMSQGQVDPMTVDYVNAHGTSTKYNDKTETRALKRTFGDHARSLAVSSTKSMIGHLLGGSSAVELVVTALSVHGQIAHPTRNYTTPDPECDLDYIPGEAREMQIRNALCNSLGFGGHNVSLLIGQPD
jgi:3-oxoacyl-[acyl-carrier-protein] synthase II